MGAMKDKGSAKKETKMKKHECKRFKTAADAANADERRKMKAKILKYGIGLLEQS